MDLICELLSTAASTVALIQAITQNSRSKREHHPDTTNLKPAAKRIHTLRNRIRRTDRAS
jgi:hypothetical protein